VANRVAGPKAVNVVDFVGDRRRGEIGALVATSSIIRTSVLRVLALSYV